MFPRIVREPASPRDIAETLDGWEVRGGPTPTRQNPDAGFTYTATKPGMRGFYTGQGATKVEALRELARAIKRG